MWSYSLHFHWRPSAQILKAFPRFKLLAGHVIWFRWRCGFLTCPMDPSGQWWCYSYGPKNHAQLHSLISTQSWKGQRTALEKITNWLHRKHSPPKPTANKPSWKQNDVHSPSFTDVFPASKLQSCLGILRLRINHIMHCSFFKIKTLLHHWKAKQPSFFHVCQKSNNNPPSTPSQLSVNLIEDSLKRGKEVFSLPRVLEFIAVLL